MLTGLNNTLPIPLCESAHDKTYNKICATSEVSDQPALTRSLIRVFADRMCRLQPPSCLKRYEREPLLHWKYTADLSLCWLHRSYGKYCRALAHFIYMCTGQDVRKYTYDMFAKRRQRSASAFLGLPVFTAFATRQKSKAFLGGQ